MDIHLGDELNLLRPFGIKTGVITNASLIWQEDVRKDLIDDVKNDLLSIVSVHPMREEAV